MAIIRNDRSKRVEAEEVEEVETEEEIDYTWHPNEDEFVSPLTTDQWAELLRDATFSQSEAGQAVRQLREYGEPATYQQLSIRYRTTMGRYRRWLAQAAQMAGERFGVPAPQQDQFGMDEWWPLLYQVRNAGKPGAGIFEMALRPEVEEAFLLLEDEERQAKRAENARQLKRIEQLERAKQDQLKRIPDAKAERTAQDVASKAKDEPSTKPTTQRGETKPALVSDGAVSVPMSRFKPVDDSTQTTVALGVQVESSIEELPATRAFLRLMEESDTQAGAMRFVKGEQEGEEGDGEKIVDLGIPVDYALRYAERLRHALLLMRKTAPGTTLASLARAMGDESVEQLQSVVNGQKIPTFDYLDSLRFNLAINVERLEAIDGQEESLPVFVTLQELVGTNKVVDLLKERVPREIAYVVDDSDDRRTGVLVSLSSVQCVLLTRRAVKGAARRSESAKLEAFIRMVDELDGFARTHGIARTSRQVTADEWDALEQGVIWPGSLLQS